MGICFVIQPFDKGKFDKRYFDVYEPAIREAGIEPYRVDCDPSVSIPIEDIVNGIKRAEICLADITTDNPNVWFELGFAIAAGKEVVLLCSKERETRYPFDVQHRTIIEYQTESASDFRNLEEEIIKRLRSLLVKERTIQELASSSPLLVTEGLQGYQVATLALVLANSPNPEMSVGVYIIRDDMEKAGYSQVASSLAIRSLIQMNYLKPTIQQDYRADEPYDAVVLTDSGFEWLKAHQDQLALYSTSSNLQADDIPF